MPKLSPKDMQAALAVAQKAFKEKFTPGFYHGSPSNKIEAFDPTKSVKDPMYITPKATFVTRDPEFAESFLSMNNSGKIKNRTAKISKIFCDKPPLKNINNQPHKNTHQPYWVGFY